MVFTGADLSNVLARSGDEIELRNEYGRHCRVLSHGEALALDSDLFVGVGNVRRCTTISPSTPWPTARFRCCCAVRRAARLTRATSSIFTPASSSARPKALMKTAAAR